MGLRSSLIAALCGTFVFAGCGGSTSSGTTSSGSGAAGAGGGGAGGGEAGAGGVAGSAGAGGSTGGTTSSSGGAGGTVGGGGPGGAPNVCGDGVALGDEDCDGADLKGATCMDFMFSTKPGVTCTADCKFDISGCKATCDGALREPGEECDGPDL